MQESHGPSERKERKHVGQQSKRKEFIQAEICYEYKLIVLQVGPDG
jgi:hypothetical protein